MAQLALPTASAPKLSHLEVVLGENGPYDILKGILSPLIHEDILSLRKSSPEIDRNKILAKVAADMTYNSLLKGFCHFKRFNWYFSTFDIVCLRSYSTRNDVKICETHKGPGLFPVCDVHTGYTADLRYKGDDSTYFYPIEIEATCAPCWSILEETQALGEPRCECSIKAKEINENMWRCVSCKAYLHWQNMRHVLGLSCDMCSGKEEGDSNWWSMVDFEPGDEGNLFVSYSGPRNTVSSEWLGKCELRAAKLRDRCLKCMRCGVPLQSPEIGLSTDNSEFRWCIRPDCGRLAHCPWEGKVDRELPIEMYIEEVD